MKRQFYFFRHGQTDWNLKRLCQGHTDIPLNETGMSEARKLCNLFEKINLDIIYSSDLTRAKQTAMCLVEKLDIELEITKNLRETHLGELEGVEVSKAKEMIDDKVWLSFNKFDQASLDIRFPGGESRGEVYDRFKIVIDHIVNETDHQHIGISTHGGALRNFLHMYMPENSKPLAIPNCVVYQLTFDPSDKESPWNVSGPLT